MKTIMALIVIAFVYQGYSVHIYRDAMGYHAELTEVC